MRAWWQHCPNQIWNFNFDLKGLWALALVVESPPQRWEKPSVEQNATRTLLREWDLASGHLQTNSSEGEYWSKEWKISSLSSHPGNPKCPGRVAMLVPAEEESKVWFWFWCSIKDYGHAWHDANHIDVILCINDDASTFSLKVWGLAYEIGDEDWEGGVSQNLAKFNRSHLWAKFSTFHQLFLVPLSISLSALVGSSKRQQILWEYHWSTKITRSNETYLGHFHLWVRFPCTSSTYQRYILRCGRSWMGGRWEEQVGTSPGWLPN